MIQCNLLQVKLNYESFKKLKYYSNENSITKSVKNYKRIFLNHFNNLIYFLFDKNLDLHLVFVQHNSK